MFGYLHPNAPGIFGGEPRMDFHWKETNGKRRLIGNPNKAMRALHERFGDDLAIHVRSLGKEGWGLRKFPSATGCIEGGNAMRNAQKHLYGRFFYLTDLKDAYPSIDLKRLALIITFIVEYDYLRTMVSLKGFATEDMEAVRSLPIFASILGFLRCHFSGMHGRGLAIGGPLSPYLMNLYCEIFLDARLRPYCEKWDITYTRYVDDLTFSSETLISEERRREIREIVRKAIFAVNHRKSRVLARSMGTVFVTKIGLAEQPGQTAARLVFLQKKRRHLHRLIHDYLARRTDWPEKVSGYIAGFLHYYNTVGEKTATDRKTFALCKAFEAEWDKYRRTQIR